MPNAEQYATLYHLLVGAVDDALSDLEQQRPEEAQTRLQAALLECEQKYLEYTETADEEGPLQETMKTGTMKRVVGTPVRTYGCF